MQSAADGGDVHAVYAPGRLYYIKRTDAPKVCTRALACVLCLRAALMQYGAPLLPAFALLCAFSTTNRPCCLAKNTLKTPIESQPDYVALARLKAEEQAGGGSADGSGRGGGDGVDADIAAAAATSPETLTLVADGEEAAPMTPRTAAAVKAAGAR